MYCYTTVLGFGFTECLEKLRYAFVPVQFVGESNGRKEKKMTLDQEIIKLVRSLPVELTGSRFFGNLKNTSDWDFFIGESFQTYEWLKTNGYMVCSSLTDYKDDNTICVFQHSAHPIHVQMVENEVLKNDAQRFLSSLPGPIRQAFLASGKNQRTVWWNWAFDICRDSNLMVKG
jgi:hypothetical protein